MPAGTYWPGIGSEVTFTPDLTSVEIEGLSNTDWSHKESNRVAEVSNSQTGNHAHHIACLDFSDGSFNVVFDSDLEPSSVGLYAGATGSLTGLQGLSGIGKTQDVIIESVDFKAVVAQGALMYAVTYKGNSAVVDF